MAYIRRLIPCAPYEIKTFEAWLEELAQEEGLFLVSCRRAFAKFEKGTPKPMRYRVDADPDRCWDPSRERQQLYEEFGWKYIDNRSEHLVVYGTDDFSLPELHTDAELQLETLGKLQKKCLRRALLVFCLFPLWLLLHISAGNWLYWLHHSALISAFVLLLFFYFLDTTKEIRQLQKLKKQIFEETDVTETRGFPQSKKKTTPSDMLPHHRRSFPLSVPSVSFLDTKLERTHSLVCAEQHRAPYALPCRFWKP